MLTFVCILLAIAAAVLAFFFLVGGAIMQDYAIRRHPHLLPFPTGEDKPARGKMRTEGMAYLDSRPHEIWHITTPDGLRLQAGFWPADEPTGRTVLAIHGYRCSGRREFGMFAPFYHALGFNVLLPDNRAHGESEGKYVGFGWLDKDDCLAWAREAHRRVPGCQILLHGISMGAATVLMAAGQDDCPDYVRGVVSDCAYSSGWRQLAWQLRCMARLPAFPTLYGASMFNRLLAGYTLHQPETVRWAARIRVPVQLIHGDADTYVPTAMVHQLYDAVPGQKRLWLAPGAPHAASWVACNQEYQDTLRAFIGSLSWPGEEQTEQ